MGVSGSPTVARLNGFLAVFSGGGIPIVVFPPAVVGYEVVARVPAIEGLDHQH